MIENQQKAVICPWCVTEMFPQWRQDADGLYRAWYVCVLDEGGCSAHSPMCSGWGRKESALEAAYAAAMKRYEPERPGSKKGLYAKYNVIKADTGEPVNDCFVLRPDRDPAAAAALRAYAKTTENKELAADIIKLVGAGQPENRVLTLNELNQLPRGTCLWAEERERSKAIWCNPPYTEENSGVMVMWRPWLRKPTPEEMNAAPWLYST